MLNLTREVLYKDGQIAANTFAVVSEDGSVPAGDVLLTAAQLDLLQHITGRKALFISADDSPEVNAYPLDQLDVIFVAFAAFTDGRGYSFAAHLRRQGFQGELRAVGDVFKDVLNYLKRCGFDSFVLKDGKDVAEAATGLNDFSVPYQASVAVEQANYQTGA